MRPKIYEHGKPTMWYLDEEQVKLFRQRYGKIASSLMNKLIRCINADENYKPDVVTLLKEIKTELDRKPKKKFNIKNADPEWYYEWKNNQPLKATHLRKRG